MPAYSLSIEAVADVTAITEDEIKTFGIAQALKYHLGIESRFDLLAQFPRIGLPTYDLRSGLYRYPYKAHTIFYTIDADRIRIVRVLLAAADFERQLQT